MMTNSTIITFHLPNAVPTQYQWLSEYYILSFARLLLACFVFGLPFLLSSVYSFCAIPKGYEGISNEELKERNRTDRPLHSEDPSSSEIGQRILYRLSVTSHALHGNTLHQQSWTTDILLTGAQ